MLTLLSRNRFLDSIVMFEDDAGVYELLNSNMITQKRSSYGIVSEAHESKVPQVQLLEAYPASGSESSITRYACLVGEYFRLG